ncbi:hypothetical protein CORC01_04860 [Colletotrichum orchidophilum]|uniref:Uncharacterized protein n=1 Tax=Colletotrichum orchidophilum TaxID=1209926 RepID=A0A1G4BEQ4_9PEZI|nr:uncharacterized protein CORC01_04860 [Colletotrichum orchidophilum]OHE99959.1 hypothetical protein CORC01_04860 [Colletotrichum orchidophilum]
MSAGCCTSEAATNHYSKKGGPRILLEQYLGSPLNVTEKLHQSAANDGQSSQTTKMKETTQFLDDWQASWDAVSKAKSTKK